jgi:hypothetical protein
MAKVLLLLPGPVKVDTRRFRRFTRDAAVPKISAVVKTMDFRGKLEADAMFEIRDEMRSITRQLQQRNVVDPLNQRRNMLRLYYIEKVRYIRCGS